MRPLTTLFLALAIGSSAAAGALPAKAAKAPANDDCLTCHADKDAKRSNGTSLAVDPKKFGASIHGQAGVACVDCHTDLATAELPHKARLKKVDCAACHDKAGAAHPFHPEIARAESGKTKAQVACADCHGSHEIAGTKDPAFRFASARQADACGACHKDVKTQFSGSSHGKAFVTGETAGPVCLSCHKNPITSGSGIEPAKLKRAQEALCLSCHVKNKAVSDKVGMSPGFIASYEQSVHGAALLRGDASAPTCVDCHGAHDERRGFDTSSLVNKMRVQRVCAQCHFAEEKHFAASVHGAALEKGNLEAPACTDCHGEHRILSPKDPRSPVAAVNVSARVCTPCHASLKVTDKWNLPRDRAQTFADSYHGLASRGGSLEVANCASCHGSHDILPSSNALSRVNRANLSTTCGSSGCHPGANERFGTGKVHVAATVKEEPVLYWIATLYLILIVAVIGGMLLHNVLDFVRKARHTLKVRRGEAAEEPVGHGLYLRMSVNERVQHVVLMVSFTLLVITGFMLRFPEAWWVAGIRRLSSRAFDLRSLLHRIAAVVMVGAGIYHVGYVALTARGRQLLKDIWWRPKDIRDAVTALKFNAGLSGERAKFDRFSYIEKSEYWAMIWGTIVMAVTGVIMWFDNTFIGLLTKLGYDISRTVHFYEAWLATLAIIVWHFYYVIFNPDAYPMSAAWLNGFLSEREMEEEHPLELERIRGSQPKSPVE